MNRLLFIFAACTLLAIQACKQDTSNQTNGNAGPLSDSDRINALAGHWVAIDFCARVEQYGSVLEAMNFSHKPYAYAFSFNPAFPDSVQCFNGVEIWMVPVKFKQDTLELVGARGDHSVFLQFNSTSAEKDIQMYDPSPSGMQMDRYIKSRAGTKDGYSAFATALNHNLLHGLFAPVGKGGEYKTQFTPGGFIMNFADYDRYELCAAGDCFVAGQDADIITMSKSKVENSSKMFGIKYSNMNDTLTIYDLVETNPAEKGTAKLGKPVYKLLRKQ